jgi:segregation and condensation protein B
MAAGLLSMSIKAKLEAIIYAAEEPVTLEQIVLLVRDAVAQEIAAERAREATEAETNSASETSSETGLSPQEAARMEAGAESATEEWPVPEPAPIEAPAGEPPADKTASQSESDEETATIEAVELPEGSAPVEKTVAALQTEGAPPEPAAPVESVASDSAEAIRDAVESENANVLTASDPPTPSDQEIRAYVREALGSLVADYASAERGMEIRQVAGGYRMATKPEHHDMVRAYAKSLKPPIKLSLAALETLAVIAYKQPVTAPEITEIRGVDCGGVLGTLLQRKLITTAGRKAVIGRPMLYKTTKEFLLRFGLKDVNELPSIEEFEKLAQEALGPDLFSDPSPPPRQEPESSDGIQAAAADSNANSETAAADAETARGSGRPDQRGLEPDNPELETGDTATGS